MWVHCYFSAVCHLLRFLLGYVYGLGNLKGGSDRSYKPSLDPEVTRVDVLSDFTRSQNPLSVCYGRI